MKTKKKLLISVLLVAFVVISLVSIIAIVFAATQQTIKTSLNISYKAEDIDATVSATMMYHDGYIESLGSITFVAGDATEKTGELKPKGNVVELSTENQYVIFEYTFKNTGEKDFVATFDYTDTDEADKNMAFGYKGEAENYKKTANAVLVNGGETKTYSVKVSIANLARDAYLSGAMAWDMTSKIIVVNDESEMDEAIKNKENKTVVLDNFTMKASYDVGYDSALRAITITSTETALLQNGLYLRTIDLKVNGLNFEGPTGCLQVENRTGSDSKFEYEIKNCSFVCESEPGDSQAIRVECYQGVDNAGSLIKNNYISGYKQGVYASHISNIKIEGNIIENTAHNAISIQSSDSTNHNPVFYCKGNIIISNNKISNTSDRAIRFGVLKDATVEISNNEFVDCTDAGSLLKAQKPANDCTYSLTNNTYNGSKLVNSSGTITSTSPQWEYFVN